MGRTSCWKTLTFFRRPDVPGRWPSKGLVWTVLISLQTGREEGSASVPADKSSMRVKGYVRGHCCRWSVRGKGDEMGRRSKAHISNSDSRAMMQARTPPSDPSILYNLLSRCQPNAQPRSNSLPSSPSSDSTPGRGPRRLPTRSSPPPPRRPSPDRQRPAGLRPQPSSSSTAAATARSTTTTLSTSRRLWSSSRAGRRRRT